MKQAKKTRNGSEQVLNQRIDAELDRILATEEELIPSSGFMASVMERVQEEAAVPPPIPFPWKRFIPGIVLITGVFGWGAVELVRLGLPMVRSLSLTVPRISTANVHSAESAGWVVLALALSLASWLLSCRLAGRRGLL
jgi:hypothetical protein